ncbi:MAG: hypothetical protein K2M00_08505, partial [Muribaculaceae bacterium]|nr:hypothetical protein [Muribaculaceae bacterium]
EEPVLVADVRPAVRSKMIDQILDNNGFFRGTATYELVHPRNKRKAKVVYTIIPGPAFPLDTIEYAPDTTALLHAVDSLARRDPYLQPGMRFSTDSLSIARNRITNSLRNRGYYFFRPDYIEYLADSVQTPGKIALRLDVANNLPAWAGNKYKTGNITVVVNRYNGFQVPDTFELRPGLTLVQMQPTRLRRALIPECITFKRGRVFSVRDMDRTQTYLARLGIFRGIDVTAFPDTTATEPTLNVLVNCTFDAPLETTIEVNASSKSNSYIGPGLTLGLTNRNIFGGGEQLSVQLTGAYERQTGRGNRGGIFNSYEAGISGSLAFPRLLAPNFIKRSRR